MARMKFQDQLRRSFVRYIFLLLAIILLLYLGGFLLNFSSVVVRANRESSRLLSGALAEQYAACEEELERLAGLPAIRRALEEGTAGDRAAASGALYAFANAQTFRPYFCLTDREGQIVCSSFNQRNQTIFAGSTFIRSAASRLDKAPDQMLSFVCTAPVTSDQACCYSFCRAVPGAEGAAGYLFFNLRSDSFSSYLRGMSQDILITDAYDNVIYTTLDREADPEDKLPSGKYSLRVDREGIFLLDGNYHYVCPRTVTPKNIQVYTLTSLEIQVKTLGFSLLLFSLLCVLLFVIIMILTQAFARRNAGEIRELTRAVAALDHGDVGYELSAQCSEEFQGLYSQFKQLVRNNNQLQERRRRMEVRHLEEQFNPHFVFNVMETVRYQIGEDPETACEMLQSFANLMRYSINYGHTKVALETDVEYINDYLLLQKIRYNNALRFQLNIPDELLECQVPKLLLQPVIENSIRHGFVQGRTLEILVEAEQAGGDLRFTVQDNGAGIPRERLEAIRESFSLELDSGIVRRIGLYNVQKVVSLLYGPEYGLSIESAPGAGTRVTLTMPWEMEE